MKIHRVEQGSPEWHALRLGIPTASGFSRIVTAGGKLSEQSKAYGWALIAERLTGEPVDAEATGWMTRGKEFEQEALSWYSLAHDVEVDRVGFVSDFDGRVGCSPDFLVGDDGGGEIKTPGIAKHIGYLLDEANENTHKPQVQGCLWLTGRKWWDVVSYHGDMAVACVRVYRDDEYIAKLADAVHEFCARLDEATQRLKQRAAA